MVTTAFSVWGYWLTGKLPTDRKPSTRISRLMTAARTGRLMKISVKFMARASSFLRRWVLVVERLHCVVDANRRAVLQFELPAGDDHRPLGHALQDRDLISTRRPRGDEHLLRLELRIAFRILLIDRDEYGCAVGVIGDRRLGKSQIGLLLARIDGRASEHAGQQQSLRIRDRGLDLHIAGGGIDLRIDRRHLAAERLAKIGVAQHRHRLTQRYAADLLLGQIEVDIDRIDGLQRY